MKKKYINKVLEDWNKEFPRFGIELPNGWFGRPYDNIHLLTYIIERDNKIILEVDKQLYLIFTKPIAIEINESTLIISDWEQFTFDRQVYGDMTANCDVYKSGIVKLIGYPTS
ncbi:MAG: hypothetical protein P1U56_22570 [Saprospiraceae bacterium]|nr:hypothetical protein [Saprospiraceae bacterium]